MVERRTENPCVASSILALGTSKKAPPYGGAFLLAKAGIELKGVEGERSAPSPW